LRGAQKYDQKGRARRKEQARHFRLHTRRIDGQEEEIMESKKGERDRGQARLDSSKPPAE
jgi:hypothetical protein